MNIQEMSAEKASTSLRVDSPSRSLADDPKAAKEAQSHKQERAEEASGAERRLDRESIEKVLAEAEERFSEKGVALKFTLSEESDEIQVEVRDAQSDKVIRKIPSDEVIRLSQSIKDMAGVFMNKPA